MENYKFDSLLNTQITYSDILLINEDITNHDPNWKRMSLHSSAVLINLRLNQQN